ncbi:MAG TPA: hypothetical protein VML01_03900 [Bryobacterales bacterium]|nr:hypothetical protein [Bryobacterales bacterium]
MNRRSWAGGLALLLAAIAAGALPAAAAGAEARLFFSRDFPQSLPAYFEVELTAAGNAVYREGPGEEPLTFQLTERERSAIFELVEQLDGLRKPIASDRKVAFTGSKVFRYDTGNGDPAEVKYTYTEDAAARLLEKWFLRMSESARHIFELERVLQFDRLGVNRALLSFQAAYDKDRIVAAHQFLPVLERIASGKQFVHIAQARATALATRIKEAGE